MIREQEHLNKMLEIKKQIYLSDSWKHRNDLQKQLDKMEKDWFRYIKIKKQNAQ